MKIYTTIYYYIGTNYLVMLIFILDNVLSSQAGRKSESGSPYKSSVPSDVPTSNKDPPDKAAAASEAGTWIYIKLNTFG